MRRAISPEQLVAILPQLTKDERGDLGDFIGRIIEPSDYKDAFHLLWGDISREAQRRLLDYFLVERPEHIMMVAPFADLLREHNADGSDLPRIQDGERPHEFIDRVARQRGSSLTRSHSIFSLRFQSYEAATGLIESGLKLSDWTDGRKIIAAFAASNSLILIPYIPLLIDRQLLSRDELSRILLEDGSPTKDHLGIFFTNGEKRRERELTEQVQKSRPTEIVTVLSTDFWPEPHRKEMESIKDSARTRAAQHILRNFDGCRRLFKSPQTMTTFLARLLDAEIPLFQGFKLTSLSEAEIRAVLAEGNNEESTASLFVLADMSDLREMVLAGFDKMALSQLCKEVRRNGVHSVTLARVINQADHVSAWLGQRNAERLFRLIDRNAPALWCTDLKALEKHSELTLAALVRKMRGDEYMFQTTYARIRGHIINGARNGSSFDIDLAGMRENARIHLEHFPSAALNQSFACHYFKPGEQARFLRARLSPDIDYQLLDRALRSYEGTDFIRAYRDELRSILHARPDYFARLLSDCGWDCLSGVFNRTERLELLHSHFELLDLDIITEDTNILSDLVKSRRHLTAFTLCLLETDNVGAMANLFETASYLLSTYGIHRYELTDIHVNRLNSLRATLPAKVIERCERDPSMVFNTKILYLFKEEARALVLRTVDDFLDLHPEFLVSLRDAEILPKELDERCFRRHQRALSLLRKRGGGSLFGDNTVSEAEQETIERYSYLERLKAARPLHVDFYVAAIELVKDSPFYKMYSRRLKSIARREVRDYGPRPTLGEDFADKEFLKILQVIATLEASPIASRHAKEIVQLPANSERENLVNLLNISVIYGLDSGSELEQAQLSTCKDILRTRVAEHAARILGLSGISCRDFDYLDVELIRATAIYYKDCCGKDIRMRNVFREMLAALSRGRYEVWRNWGSETTPVTQETRSAAVADMQKLRLLPKRIKLSEYEEWIRESQKEVMAELDYDIRDVSKGIQEIFSLAIADHHIPAAELDVDYATAVTEYDNLTSPIRKWAQRITELKEAMNGLGKNDPSRARLAHEHRELQQAIERYRKDQRTTINQALARIYVARLRNFGIRCLSKDILDMGVRRVVISEVISTLSETFDESFPEFSADIRRINSLLNQFQETRSGKAPEGAVRLRVTDTVDFKTYFLIGEQPVESCQCYESDNANNRGLLSIVTDPQVRVIQVYDDANKIVARGILRLLEDKDGLPQLFLERLYSANPHPKIFAAIVEFAREKAARVGVGLYSHLAEPNQEGDSFLDLYGWATRSSFVYTDSGDGLCKRGEFKISGAARVT